MTHRRDEPFSFHGIVLPWTDPNYVPRITTGYSTACLVQSFEDGKVYIHKWMVPVRFFLPPEFRASSFHPQQWPGQILPPNILHPAYVLPDEPYFQKIVCAEATPLPPFPQHIQVYSTYIDLRQRAPNGGSLYDLVEKHYLAGRAIPEPFIWHVLHQLSEALLYMYRNRGRGDVPPDPEAGPYPPGQAWQKLFHRNLSLKSIYLHYEPRGPGATPNTGQIRNALPIVRIGDWDHSCMEGDRRPRITAGRFGQDPVEWEDAMAFGQIARSLLMAHVPLWDPVGNPCPTPGQVLVEGQGWDERPDSRQIAFIPQPANFQYTQRLLIMLQPFEIPGIQYTGVPFPGANRFGGPAPAPNPMTGVPHPFPGSTAQPNQAGLPGPVLYETDINYICNYASAGASDGPYARLQNTAALMADGWGDGLAAEAGRWLDAVGA
ncbi:serine/threonine protein kinase [Apiospora aurea]|uniref:Serine/threonine protein kinase n=1 Tax=Apiospora aurea TaxID=335848 RepID=A0ABR1PWG3_9PEZI